MTLVLTRFEGQTIHIGNDIVVTLVKADRGKGKIGIDAPKDVTVWRDEIYQQIQKGTATDTRKHLTSVCAWCEQESGIKTPGPNVTHTICAAHMEKMLAELKGKKP